ncbi:MAG TPA: DUF5985 family protein [Thermoanaerobaculia bacterium]|nr:DUF5985 family protein [Thermoanaerobaculia bacterium]
MTAAVAFLSGLITMMYIVIAVFFLRFWRDSADRLFFFFAGAFAILAVQRFLLLLFPTLEALYVLRLLAFVLIIAAIVDKNRQSRSASSGRS